MSACSVSPYVISGLMAICSDQYYIVGCSAGQAVKSSKPGTCTNLWRRCTQHVYSDPSQNMAYCYLCTRSWTHAWIDGSKGTEDEHMMHGDKVHCLWTPSLHCLSVNNAEVAHAWWRVDQGYMPAMCRCDLLKKEAKVKKEFLPVVDGQESLTSLRASVAVPAKRSREYLCEHILYNI